MPKKIKRFLSKSDRVILDKLCKHGLEYLKVDISKLAKNTKLARNTVSSRVEHLIKTKNLKLIAAENMELQGFEKVFVTIDITPETPYKKYLEIVDFLAKQGETEEVFQMASSDLMTLDKFLFHYRFARYNPETGEMEP